MAEVNPTKVVERVLELAELDDYAGILNIAASSKETCISKGSPTPALRKLYLKLSLIIHPDRVGKTIPNATKAFQALVKSFETLSEPDLQDDKPAKKGRGEKETKTIARSNDNCFRTRVCCPRCKQRWSEDNMDGNPDYFYNFLMSGLKQYMCSTCLCQFGCMTAIHKCPHCKKQFDYSPADYHQQVTCHNKGCNKLFGFYLFPTSDRVMKEMKDTMREEQEARIKATEAKQRRAARSNRGQVLSQKELEASFLLGLSDCCPRCGEDFTEIEDEEEQLKHLSECTDTVKHAAFAKKKADSAAKQSAKEAKKSAQESAQTLAAWQFLGANSSQLWLLDDVQLRQQAKDAQLDATGDKDELIARLVRKSKESAGDEPQAIEDDNSGKTGRKRGSSTALVVSSGESGAVKKSKASSSVPRKSSSRDIPSNIHSMTLPQLRAVCASNDILHLIDKGMTKAEVLDVLENEFYESKETKIHYIKN